jgi:hypothetical protein
MMVIKNEIEAILAPLSLSERIALLESLGKKYRRENSKRLNNLQFGRIDNDRPDLVALKDQNG